MSDNPWEPGVDDLLWLLAEGRRELYSISRKLKSARHFFFNRRDLMSAFSDRLNVVTAQLSAVENQFPGAVAAALKAAATGASADDGAANASLIALEDQTTATIAALQASLPVSGATAAQAAAAQVGS